MTEEVQLNLSLKTDTPNNDFSNNSFIGPVIPSHNPPTPNNSVRKNPYFNGIVASCDVSGQNDEKKSPKKICNKTSPVKEKSISPIKHPLSSNEHRSVNDIQTVVKSSSVTVPAVISPTKRSHAPQKGTTKRTPRDITKSRRYQSSLSFLLSSMTEEDCSPKCVDTNESENVKSENDVTVKMDCSNELIVPEFVGITLPKSRDTPEKRKVPELPEIIRKHSDTEPSPQILHNSKRPCPHKFKQPTLTKTTSKLFSSTPNNYLKGCKWSPDGLALLTCSRDKVLRIFNTPDTTSVAEQHPSARHCTASVPYDTAWNPEIDHLSARNCNLLVSCKDSPVQLLNAFSGNTIASFTAFNNVEVLISAFSVCYLSRDTLLAGYCKHVRVFDATRPGRDCSVMTVGDLQHQNNNSIVSTVAPHPTTQGLFGAGCYNSTVALYSTQIPGVLLPFYGPQHGVTQILFSHDGNKLYCGSRMEGEIYCFDTRYNGSVLTTFKRDVQTNQRIQFDINKSETLLATGNHDGTVLLYDLTRDQTSSNQDVDMTSCDQVTTNENELRFEAHRDTVNGVSFHPFWGLLATSSGRRHFHVEDNEIEENSLKIWSF